MNEWIEEGRLILFQVRISGEQAGLFVCRFLSYATFYGSQVLIFGPVVDRRSVMVTRIQGTAKEKLWW